MESKTRSSVAGVGSVVIAWLTLVWAASAQFVFHTASVGRDEPSAVVAAATMATTVALVAVFGPASMAEIRRVPTLRLAVAVCGAAIAFGAAPYLVLANRHSDAPSGAIVLFWTTAFWGFLLVLGGALVEHRSYRAVGVSASLLALAGAAGVLANWERPSSFSLLTRFPAEQTAMAIAGLVWVIGILVLARESRLSSARVAAAAAAAGCLLVGVVASAVAGPVAVMSSASTGLGVSAIVASAAFAVLVLWAAGKAGTLPAGVALIIVPTALSALTLLEQAIGALGPRPMLVTEVLWACALVVAASGLAIDSATRTPESAAEPSTPSPSSSLLGTAGRTFAVLAVAAAIAGLATPGVAVSVAGLRTDMSKFSTEFSMLGVETVGGWIALAAALVVAGLWFGRHRPGLRIAGAALGALLVAGGAWLVLRSIPLHTWVSWIPADVQQDYGTEYARIVFTGVRLPAQWATIGLALAAGLTAGVEALGFSEDPRYGR